jgi:hypothetical protein
MPSPRTTRSLPGVTTCARGSPRRFGAGAGPAGAVTAQPRARTLRLQAEMYTENAHLNQTADRAPRCRAESLSPWCDEAMLACSRGP